MTLTLNRQSIEVAPGSTLLDAAHQAGIDIPTLCHDPRLKPSAACRLCLVEVEGQSHPVPACSTPAAEGLIVETHSAEVEDTRRTLLGLLAAGYPTDLLPDKPFHQLLHRYGIVPTPDSTRVTEPFLDLTHPHLAVDMTRCITCFRCIRICEQVQGQDVWHALGRGKATRIVPDGPTLLTSSCVSCGACSDTCPTGAIEDQSRLRHPAPTHWTRTTCPYCGVGCEMHVGSHQDRIVQIRPAMDAPVNKGHLCVKGRYAFDFNHSPDRITSPMIRRGTAWHPIGWDEAIQYIAKGLQRIRRESGPDAIGMLGSARGTNEENYLAQKFARLVLGTNNVDSCARVCHAPTATAMKLSLGTGAATHSFDDIELAAGFLLCGTNATENHPIVGARIRQAVRKGARLIVIDPRQIELARIADIHLQPRPGTNIPLLNALAHVIVEEGLQDDVALRERVSGWDAFKGFIRDFSPERVAGICGVDPDLIRRAARLHAATRPLMCFHGLGMTEHSQGTEGVLCLVNLALITGNLAVPGAGVNPLRGQNNVQGAAHMGCEPDHGTGYVPLETGRESIEAVWGAPIPRTQGLNLLQMIDAAGTGQVRALWSIGYDIALTNAQADVTRAALDRLDLLIVQDLFLNETARQSAHVFLPAASSFEKEGTFMNSERRIQRVRRAVPPPGQARPDWEILCDVARALDHGAQFNFHSAEAIWEEIRSVWKAGAGIRYDRLDHGGIQWPCPDPSHPGTTRLHATRFPNGTHAPLQCVGYIPSPETVSDQFPFLLMTGRTLHQFNSGTMTGRTPNSRLRPADTVDIAPIDATRLGLTEGCRVRVISRHGESLLPIRLDPRLRPGELFATFHTVEALLNRLTSPHRDTLTQTPEYKVVAVRLEPAPA